MADDPDQPQKTNREDLQVDHDESVNPLLVPGEATNGNTES